MRNVLLAAFVIISVALVPSCAKERVKGCTDPYALNFDPGATDNNGNCWVPIQTKKVLIANFTKTSEEACGDWGITEFESAINQTFGRAEPIVIHSDDEMSNDIGDALSEYYEVDGYPTFRVWEQGQDYEDSTDLIAAVDQEIVEKSVPEAGAVVNIMDNGQKVTIEVSAGVFLPAAGDYFVAVYIMEDSLVFPQNGANDDPDSDDYPYLDNFVHNHVLRGSANGEWGEQFVFGAGFTGQVLTKTYVLDKDLTWNMNNVYAVAVVWKYVKDQQYGEYVYEFVNVSSSKDLITY
ncbi:MAG: Omp28-related outer membrane protein [Chitinophagales bacterium]|nr:Omp28-related outer membrane protein [Chitinophagales bacterium]